VTKSRKNWSRIWITTFEINMIFWNLIWILRPVTNTSDLRKILFPFGRERVNIANWKLFQNLKDPSRVKEELARLTYALFSLLNAKLLQDRWFALDLVCASRGWCCMLKSLWFILFQSNKFTNDFAETGQYKL
jgi:hypothetical protein